jgi:hypothetical protein
LTRIVLISVSHACIRDWHRRVAVWSSGRRNGGRRSSSELSRVAVLQSVRVSAAERGGHEGLGLVAHSELGDGDACKLAVGEWWFCTRELGGGEEEDGFEVWGFVEVEMSIRRLM